MLDELRKIWSELHVKILVLLLIVVSIGLSIAPINSNAAFVRDSSESINIIKGKAAIKIQKEQYEGIKGELSLDKVNDVLNYYQSIADPDTAYLETSLKFPGVLPLLSDAYSPGNTSEFSNLITLENADDFYERNTVKIAEILNDFPNDYKTLEEAVILKKANAIKTPFTIDYNKQWIDSYKSLNILFILIAMTAIVVGSTLFSYEKEKKMDMILVTFGEAKLKKIGRNKMFALLTFLSLLFLVSVLIVSIITFSVLGLEGITSQIQTKYFTSIHPLTFGSAYLLFIFMGWLCIMAIGSLVSTINVVMKKSYASLTVGFLVVIVPLVILRFDTLPLTVRKFLSMQPINGFNMIKNISSLQIVSFFNLHMLTTTAIIIYALIILIGCFFIAPNLFISRIKDK